MRFQVTTPIAAFGKQTPHSLVSGTDAASPDTPFRTLLYDPIRFVPGEVTDAPYFYDREAFPTFNGTGVTMAMWCAALGVATEIPRSFLNNDVCQRTSDYLPYGCAIPGVS